MFDVLDHLFNCCMTFYICLSPSFHSDSDTTGK